MGILANLPNMNLGLKGVTPTGYIPTAKNSKLHNNYSINGNPTLNNKPSPSTLDLQAQVPAYNYRANAPENRTF